MNQNKIANGAPNGADQPPVLYEDPKAIRRSPFNRTIDTKAPEFLELVESVRIHGVIEPPVVRRGVEGLELIAGERRTLAAIEARQTQIPVILRVATDLEVLELQTIENDQRADLSPIERAEKYQQLLKQYEELGMKREAAIEKLAERVGKKRATIYEILRLTALAPVAKKALEAGRLPQSHAGLVAKLEKYPDLQAKAVKEITEDVAEWAAQGRAPAGNYVMGFREAKVEVEQILRYGERRTAWYEAVKEAKAKGLQVLEGKEAEKALEGNDYVRGDSCNWNYPGSDPTYDNLMGKKAPPAILTHDSNFNQVKLYPRAAALEAINANGKKKTHPGLNRSAQARGAAEAKRMAAKAAKTRKETAERRAIVAAAVEAAGKPLNWTAKKTFDFLHFMLRAMYQRVLHDTHREMFGRRKLNPKDWKKGYESPSRRWLKQQIKEVKTAEQARALIVDMAVAMDLTMWAGESFTGEPKMLDVACQLFNVDRKVAIRRGTLNAAIAEQRKRYERRESAKKRKAPVIKARRAKKGGK